MNTIYILLMEGRQVHECFPCNEEKYLKRGSHEDYYTSVDVKLFSL